MNAWTRYVRELCRHFHGRVRFFEVWNEPEAFWTHNGKPLLKTMSSAERARDYTEFVARTAAVVRSEIPDAPNHCRRRPDGNRLYQSPRQKQTRRSHRYFQLSLLRPRSGRVHRGQSGKSPCDLVPSDPAKNSVSGRGESGRASGKSILFSFPTELAQAKYLARRYLTDLVCGVELSSIFTVTDFLCYYSDGSDQFYGVIDAKNNCGKLAYYTMQGMGFLFDGLETLRTTSAPSGPATRRCSNRGLHTGSKRIPFGAMGNPVFAFWTPEHVEISAPTVPWHHLHADGRIPKFRSIRLS